MRFLYLGYALWIRTRTKLACIEPMMVIASSYSSVEFDQKSMIHHLIAYPN